MKQLNQLDQAGLFANKAKRHFKKALPLLLASAALAGCGESGSGLKSGGPIDPNQPAATTTTPAPTTTENYNNTDQMFYDHTPNPGGAVFPNKGTILQQEDEYVGLKFALKIMREQGLPQANIQTFNHAVEDGTIVFVGDNNERLDPNSVPSKTNSVTMKPGPDPEFTNSK